MIITIFQDLNEPTIIYSHIILENLVLKFPLGLCNNLINIDIISYNFLFDLFNLLRLFLCFWNLNSTIVVLLISTILFIFKIIEIQDLIIDYFITIVDLFSDPVSSPVFLIDFEVSWLDKLISTVSMNQEGI